MISECISSFVIGAVKLYSIPAFDTSEKKKEIVKYFNFNLFFTMSYLHDDNRLAFLRSLGLS